MEDKKLTKGYILHNGSITYHWLNRRCDYDYIVCTQYICRRRRVIHTSKKQPLLDQKLLVAFLMK